MIRNQKNMRLKSLSLPNERPVIVAFWAFTFVLLTAVGAQMEIPNQPVPFTLQTFFVLLAGAILEKRIAALSMGLYLIFGAMGLPFFSGGAFGLARLIGPSGGYLLSFPIAAFIVGYLVNLRTEYWWMIVSMCVGSLIIFSVGLIQLNYVYFHNWNTSLQSGFLIFSWWDVLKIAGASTIAHSYHRRIKHSQN